MEKMEGEFIQRRDIYDEIDSRNLQDELRRMEPDLTKIGRLIEKDILPSLLR